MEIPKHCSILIWIESLWLGLAWVAKPFDSLAGIWFDVTSKRHVLITWK